MVSRVGWLLAILFTIIACGPASADDLLPSRNLEFPPIVIDGTPYINFDIFDVHQELEHPPRVVPETEPRSIFVKRRHIGLAIGNDNGNLHTSVGFYWTIAEWKRLNFGVPAIEVGLGRYAEYSAALGHAVMKDEPTLLLSLASIHYRVGYMRMFGLNFYLNFEQVHDIRERFVGSQFGISFSK